ncbi:nucleoside hydrolase [Trebonia kvetii]|uniref:Nucleoside hydrolase n=1 Tax=Trebonia kvetii TaxID=2480626 RepID=A0A6P2BKX6_9ACTN|nr:nucleoside hydrolase [Trebonia kvetii]TVY99092.1 nucleoside hydrolase [Trebonia kvetii]
MSIPIILDCDPGIDDALAISFAAGSPEIELAGITTVAGNVPLAKTTANALAVAAFAGLPDVPVTPGCAAPLLRPALHADHVHGESGLGGAALPAPRRSAESGHAIDFIIDTVAAARGEITLVATGPLTNIGLALRREPRLASWVRDFVIMGGSASRGNVTPAAEFNIWADPEAAAVVFGAGWSVRMIGLDVTLLARATAAIQERMSSLGSLGSTLLLPALAQYRDADDETGEPPVHDVCAIVSIADPSVFEYTPAQVAVETHGALTSGMTVTDFSASAAHNARVATAINAERFWRTVLSAYGSLPVAQS